MNKFILPTMGIGGVSAMAAGGYMLFSDKESSQTWTKQEETVEASKKQTTSQSRTYPENTYGHLHKQVILNTESSSDRIWEYRLEDLKKADLNIPGYRPRGVYHPKLREIVSKYSSDTQKAKALHKEACQEIFNTKHRSGVASGDWDEDVRKYCSHKVKDKFGNQTYENHSKESLTQRIKELSDKNFKVVNLDDKDTFERDFNSEGGSVSSGIKGAWLSMNKKTDISQSVVDSLNRECADFMELAYGDANSKSGVFQLLEAFCFKSGVNS
ncbi:hypothetical protein MHC_03495 [Mycoplasma haemocanis str. Illinois]|uniref:Uncharacterized protein n=1 Tax=Mycoplasma haemocanis (strain Illinois) TaxID=1111676 RepID=H6N7D7_MYCHN|nr:hypothetical protein [Mycoplasma haemocanis]AEW45559.2 hypothetical protein MHC_03495 [Mycoplasma haemocanis str. Illinois]